jgi:Spy/CpxP family protein refolding chaperone
MKKILLIIFLLGFSILNSFIFSQELKIPHNLPPEEVLKDLNLTKEQKEKIETIRRKIEKENIALRAELKIKKIELKEMLDDSTIKEKEIFKKIEEIGEIEKKILKNRISGILELRKVLTPEQIEKLKEHHRLKGKHFLPERKNFQQFPPRKPPFKKEEDFPKDEFQ